MNFLDSDAMDKVGRYLESENMNKIVISISIKTGPKRMDELLSIMGTNDIFTIILDMDAGNIIELYMRRNNVKHCFRTINTMDIAFCLYHKTPHKIRVICSSLSWYLFLAPIRAIIKPMMELYITTINEVLLTINMVYMKGGNSESALFYSEDKSVKKIKEGFDIEKVTQHSVSMIKIWLNIRRRSFNLKVDVMLGCPIQVGKKNWFKEVLQKLSNFQLFIGMIVKFRQKSFRFILMSAILSTFLLYFS